jgi:hypothetical protein
MADHILTAPFRQGNGPQAPPIHENNKKNAFVGAPTHYILNYLALNGAGPVWAPPFHAQLLAGATPKINATVVLSPAVVGGTERREGETLGQRLASFKSRASVTGGAHTEVCTRFSEQEQTADSKRFIKSLTKIDNDQADHGCQLRLILTCTCSVGGRGVSSCSQVQAT